MRPDRLFVVPCTVIASEPTGMTGTHGETVLQEAATTAKCWYSSPTTEERLGQVFTTLTVYFSPEVVLDHVTRIDIEGLGSFEVEGTPLAHMSPRTRVPTHQTVKVRAGA